MEFIAKRTIKIEVATFVIELLACCQAPRGSHLHRTCPLSVSNRPRGTMSKKRKRSSSVLATAHRFQTHVLMSRVLRWLTYTEIAAGVIPLSTLAQIAESISRINPPCRCTTILVAGILSWRSQWKNLEIGNRVALLNIVTIFTDFLVHPCNFNLQFCDDSHTNLFNAKGYSSAVRFYFLNNS